MGYQTGIAAAIAEYGLEVVEYTGWRTRGNPVFDPRGVIVHHTGPPLNTETMVNICIRGRPDLPGPLCHVVLSPSGVAHVIAAGRANHAGTGGWRGLSGNRSVFGVEAVHTGDPRLPWPAPQIEAFFRISAALCKLARCGADMVCAHREWAPNRKYDPVNVDMADFRRVVAYHLSQENPMPDNPDLPNFATPFHSFHPVVGPDYGDMTEHGPRWKCLGYYMVSESGEVHTHGPGAVYHGRSEEPGG